MPLFKRARYHLDKEWPDYFQVHFSLRVKGIVIKVPDMGWTWRLYAHAGAHFVDSSPDHEYTRRYPDISLRTAMRRAREAARMLERCLDA